MAAGRGRSEYRDGDRGQRGVDVFPRLRGVRLAIGVGGQRLVDIFLGQLEPGAARRFAQRDAVDADLDLDDILDAVRGAGVEFLLLHPARGVGVIGRVAPDALAKALAAAAGRSEEHTSELKSLMCISYAVFRLKKKKKLTP